MKLNRTWAMVVAIVMALTLSLSGTLAYLQDQDADVNVMVLGNVQITQNEQERVKDADGKFTSELKDFTNNQTIYPAVYNVAGQDDPARMPITVGDYTYTYGGGFRAFPNYVDKIVTVTNTGKSDAYVRTMIAIPSKNTETETNLSEEWLHYNVIVDTDTQPANGWYAGKTLADGEWNGTKNYLYGITINGNNYEVYTATNVNVLKPGATTGPCLAGFYLDNSVNYVDGAYVDVNGDEMWTDDTLDILVISQAVQAAGFADAYTALNAGYGEVNSENVTKWFNALYNEDGSINNDMIGTPGEDYPNNNPPILVSTIAELEAALENGATAVTLTDDITLEDNLTATTLTLYGEGNIDLADKTLTTTGGLYIEGDVTLENGSVAETAAGSYGPISQLGSNVTYDNVNVVTAGGGLNVRDTVVWNEGNITINCATSSPRHMFYVASGNDQCNGHLTINGGEFTFNPSNLTRKGSYICAHGEGATVIVNGGTFNKPSTRTAPIQALEGGTVTIYGGSFAFDPSDFVAEGYQAVKGDNGYWTVSAITE